MIQTPHLSDERDATSSLIRTSALERGIHRILSRSPPRLLSADGESLFGNSMFKAVITYASCLWVNYMGYGSTEAVIMSIDDLALVRSMPMPHIRILGAGFCAGD